MSATGGSGTDAALWPWAVASGAILAQQVGSKTVRDGIFLAQLSAEALPSAMLFAALLAAPIVLGVSYAISRFGPGRVATRLLVVSAALFGLEWVLLPTAPVVAAWLVYLHIATLGGTTLSAFFSCIAERFDPHTARRASGVMMSGAAIGGLIGGLLVSLLARALDDRALLLALAVTNFGCALGIARIASSTGASDESAPAGFALVSLTKSPYLRTIASLVLLTGFVSALLDYAFKAGASASVGTGPSLLQLFAAFHATTALLTALVQVGLAQRALERLGLAGTLAILPASVLLSGVAGAWMPLLWGRALARGASTVFESSLYRSAYEPLYTPLSQRTRRATKTLIDVAAGRAGEALGSGVLLALAWFGLGAGTSTPVLILAMAGAALSLVVSLQLHSGYVEALTASLRKGSVKLDERHIADSTTRLTMSQTHAELTRGELLAQIAAMRASLPAPKPELRATGTSAPSGFNLNLKADPSTSRGNPSSRPPGSSRDNARSGDALPAREGFGLRSAPLPRELSAAVSSSMLESPIDPADVPLLSAANDLLSGDRGRALRVLGRGPLDPRLVPLALPLLANSSMVEPVTAALKTVANEHVGQLVDALHDPKQPLLVRRRIPRILKVSAQPRAAQGLIEALRATEPELRQRVALALSEMTSSKPELAPDPRLVFELAREELRTSTDEPVPLHHLFAILSLALERDALWHARRALNHGDARQRGTALEYLHNTLPEPLRSEFLAQLESGQIRTSNAPRNSRPPDP